MRGGGADVALGSVLADGMSSASASLLVTWGLPRIANTDLIAAEVAQWKAGALLSAVIGVGGAIALLLAGTSWAAGMAYADPVLVLLACVLIAPVAIRMLHTAGRELLEAAPPPLVQAAIAQAVTRTCQDFELPEPSVATSKLGNRLYLEVIFLVDAGWQVSDEDEIRHSIIDRLAPLEYDLWANVELTTDESLAE